MERSWWLQTRKNQFKIAHACCDEVIKHKRFLHSLWFFEFANLLNVEHQVAPVHIFHDEVETILIMFNGHKLEPWGSKTSKYTFFTSVWKQECSWVRNGGFSGRARTRFSIIVHSTSSSWTMTSFFKTLIAKISSVPLRSASKTYTKQKVFINEQTAKLYLLKFQQVGCAWIKSATTKITF